MSTVASKPEGAPRSFRRRNSKEIGEAEHAQSEAAVRPTRRRNTRRRKSRDNVWQQGDAAFETPEMKARRQALRDDPLVGEALDAWWDATDADGNGFIDRDEYLLLGKALYHVMIPDGNEAAARKSAAADWDEDSAGATLMTGEMFKKAIFQLADLWTETVEPAEYVAFLDDLLEKMKHHGLGTHLLNAPPAVNAPAASAPAVHALKKLPLPTAAAENAPTQPTGAAAITSSSRRSSRRPSTETIPVLSVVVEGAPLDDPPTGAAETDGRSHDESSPCWLLPELTPRGSDPDALPFEPGETEVAAPAAAVGRSRRRSRELPANGFPSSSSSAATAEEVASVAPREPVVTLAARSEAAPSSTSEPPPPSVSRPPPVSVTASVAGGRSRRPSLESLTAPTQSGSVSARSRRSSHDLEAGSSVSATTHSHHFGFAAPVEYSKLPEAPKGGDADTHRLFYGALPLNESRLGNANTAKGSRLGKQLPLPVDSEFVISAPSTHEPMPTQVWRSWTSRRLSR